MLRPRYRLQSKDRCITLTQARDSLIANLPECAGVAEPKAAHDIYAVSPSFEFGRWRHGWGSLLIIPLPVMNSIRNLLPKWGIMGSSPKAESQEAVGTQKTLIASLLTTAIRSKVAASLVFGLGKHAQCKIADRRHDTNRIVTHRRKMKCVASLGAFGNLGYMMATAADGFE